MKRNLILIISIIISVLTADLILKNVFDGKEFDFLSPFIRIMGFSHNTGGAFSVFSGNVAILAVISIVFMVAFTVYNLWEKENNLLKWISYSLIIGGALGNLADRVFLGYVRDFLKFDFLIFGWDFPVFNFADICLSFGIILFAVNTLFILNKKSEKPL